MNRNLFAFLAIALFANMAITSVRTSPVVLSPEAQQLTEHSEEFAEKKIMRVSERVYVAVNYALANMILIRAPDGLVIIDTLENSDIALQVLEEFRTTSLEKEYTEETLPLRGIILTHSHKDHIAGAQRLLEENANCNPVVIAHSSLTETLERYQLKLKALWRRTSRQHGFRLPEGEHINNGIGLKLAVGKHFDLDPLPTYTFDVSSNFTLAGMNFGVYHTPGESGDQIAIWLPDEQAVMPGDNIYKSFPNLYSIKGEQARDVKAWYESLDLVLSLNPEHMVPSHTLPVSGGDQIREIVTSYRDAIQFVHDQTVRHINLGTSVSQMAAQIKLPDKLRAHPFLQEYYGAVAWSVRGVYQYYMGWFDGRASSLFPLTSQQEAELYVSWLSRSQRWERESTMENIIFEMNRAVMAAENLADDKEDMEYELKWALKLGDMASFACQGFHRDPLCGRMFDLQATAMRRLADRQVNANARNYYLARAREIQLPAAALLQQAAKSSQLYLSEADPDYLMSLLPGLFDPTSCSCQQRVSGRVKLFHPHRLRPKAYRMEQRNCVLRVHRMSNDELDTDDEKSADFVVDTNLPMWRKVLQGDRAAGYRVYMFNTKGRSKKSFVSLMTRVAPRKPAA